SRRVSAWSREGANETRAEEIITDRHNRHRAVDFLNCFRGLVSDGENSRHLQTEQFGDDARKFLPVFRAKPNLDADVLSDDVARFLETSAQGSHSGRLWHS